jgi:hypothetical protein
MDFDQIIGYIIMFIALIVFMRKSKNKDLRKNQSYEEPDFHKKSSHEKKLRDFLNSLKDDEDTYADDFKKPPLKHKPLQTKVVAPKAQAKVHAEPDLYHQKSTIEDRRLKSSIEERKFQSSIENRQLRTNIESRYDDPYGKRTKVLDLKSQADAPSYGVIGRASGSKSNEIIANLKSKKQMIILNEIISPPKSLKEQ